MKKFILICIFPALAAILSSCANEDSGATPGARQPDADAGILLALAPEPRGDETIVRFRDGRGVTHEAIAHDAFAE